MIRRSSALSVAATIAIAFPLLAQSMLAQNMLVQSSAERAAANAARLHDAWGEKMSTPNTSLAIKEASRSGDAITFRLYATGVPKDTVFSLLVWPFTQRGPSETATGITLDDIGLAICAGQPDACGDAGKPNEPLDITWNPLPGEPIRLGLMSPDGSWKLYAKLAAIPIRGEDKGCTANATLLTPGAEILAIEGNGFPAGSEITMDYGSEQEPHIVKDTADSSGRYLGVVLPFRLKSVGSAIKITLKSAQCSPAVNVILDKTAQ